MFTLTIQLVILGLHIMLYITCSYNVEGQRDGWRVLIQKFDHFILCCTFIMPKINVFVTWQIYFTQQIKKMINGIYFSMLLM